MRSDSEAPPTLGVGTAGRSESCWRPRWDWRRAAPETETEADNSLTETPETPVEKVNLENKFALFSEHWKPKVVGQLNGQQVKLAKLSGSFVWHHHETEDELFLVVNGHLRMELRDRTVELGPGEFLIVPRGVEHRPVAEGEVEVLLFEPTSTLNTGNVRNERTAEALEHL
ncbi:cupin domain-containing protein [Stigmatella sp. ncwal1]|uniref:Cupin domain-containing protein n=1 Tax=Stigmatella ashevillensis TaxID=2995309 RepID=A0ABT5DEG3_9BACT|nr:cupin domain-containing protein [Stigmatella ashevillena]MDC0711964.1 cupin domain-containing protein [Stigmatella ashevillena]